MGFTRIWTIFEQFVAIKLGVEVAMALPSDAIDSLLTEFEKGKEGIKNVTKALGNVDSKNARAFFRKDEERVKKLIQGSLGFEGVNEKIKLFFVRWVAVQVQTYMGMTVTCPPTEDDAQEVFV